MSFQIIKTKDNSQTLYSEQYKEHYHSINGAITESQHIFINLGFNNFENKNINILEIGYGTALNAILTFNQNKINQNTIFYHGLDTFPITKEEANYIHYNHFSELDQNKYSSFFEDWDTDIQIDNNFNLLKQKISLLNFIPQINYDLIYFDAFSPETQAEMWTSEIFKKIADCTSKNSILVTYCSKGTVKRLLRENGFNVMRKTGPPGKRHVLFAVKQ